MLELGNEKGEPFFQVPLRGRISAVEGEAFTLVLDDGATTVTVELGLAGLFSCEGEGIAVQDLSAGAEVLVDGIYDAPSGTVQETSVIVKVCAES